MPIVDDRQREAGGGPRGIVDDRPPTQAAAAPIGIVDDRPPREVPGTARQLGATALRIGAPLVGTLIGGALSSPTGPGMLAGGTAGALAGTSFIEPFAQRLEGVEYSPLEHAAEVGLTLIPGFGVGKTLARTVGKQAVGGAIMAGGQSEIRPLAREGRLATAGELGFGAASGAGIGAGLGLLLSLATRRRARGLGAVVDDRPAPPPAEQFRPQGELFPVDMPPAVPDAPPIARGRSSELFDRGGQPIARTGIIDDRQALAALEAPPPRRPGDWLPPPPVDELTPLQAPPGAPGGALAAPGRVAAVAPDGSPVAQAPPATGAIPAEQLFGSPGERGAVTIDPDAPGRAQKRLADYFGELRQEAVALERGALERELKARSGRAAGSLGDFGLRERGTAPPRLHPETGLPIEAQTGSMSARNPAFLARALLTDDPDVNRTLNEVAGFTRNEVEYARRGVVPDELVNSRGDEIKAWIEGQVGTDPAVMGELRMRGQALNAEQLRGLAAFAFVNREAGLKATQRALRTGRSQDQLEAVYRQSLSTSALLQAAGAAAEAGRALRTARVIREQLGGGGEAVKKLVKWFGGSDALEEYTRRALLLANDPVALNRFVREIQPSTTSDKVFEFYINALMSGPPGRIVDAISTALMSGRRPFESALAGGFDFMRAKLTGTPRERFLGEAAVDVVGQVMGVRQGGRAFLRTMVTEIPAEGQTRWIEPGTSRHAIKGILGRGVRVPTTFAAAQDDAMKAMTAQGFLFREGYRKAAREGLYGQARIDRMAEIAANPNAIEGLTDATLREKEYRTFQSPLGDAGNAVLQLRRSVPGLRWLLPFVRTPINLAKVGLRDFSATVRVPYRLLRHGAKMTGGEVSEELAQFTIGASMAGLVATLVSEGKITGSGPSDPEQRRALQATGWQPNSIKIGSQWISYQRLDPVAMSIGMLADAYENRHLLEVEDASASIAAQVGELLTQGAGLAIRSTTRNITDKTFLKGLSDAVSAIDNPERYGTEWVQSFAGSFVPTGVAQIARAEDPTFRRPRTLEQVLQNRIPGQRDRVPLVRDIWGEPIMRIGGTAEAMLSPFPRREISSDAASAEVSRLGVAPGSPTRQLQQGGERVDLTDEEYDEYTEKSGKLAHHMALRVIQTPAYQQASDDTKRSIFDEVFTRARKAVRQEIVKPKAVKRRVAELVAEMRGAQTQETRQ